VIDTYFKVQFNHLSLGTDQNDEKCQDSRSLMREFKLEHPECTVGVITSTEEILTFHVLT
jgi:hypothetical protein